jgi:hypothetical protein
VLGLIRIIGNIVRGKGDRIVDAVVVGGSLLKIVMDVEDPAPKAAEAEKCQNQKRDQTFHSCGKFTIFLAGCK